MLNPNYKFTTRNERIYLVADNPEVRALIAAEAARPADEGRFPDRLGEMYLHPEEYFPEHTRFLKAMGQYSKQSVSPRSYERYENAVHQHLAMSGVLHSTLPKPKPQQRKKVRAAINSLPL